MPRIRVDLLIFNRQGLNFKADFANLEYRWWFGGADRLGSGCGGCLLQAWPQGERKCMPVTGTPRIVLLRDA